MAEELDEEAEEYPDEEEHPEKAKLKRELKDMTPAEKRFLENHIKGG